MTIYNDMYMCIHLICFSGLADPYVKGQLGPYRFRTKTQKRTLTPKWHEEFKVPIRTWESPNVLGIEVRDKDRFVDDKMGSVLIFSLVLLQLQRIIFKLIF